jgi:hypothetical protein
MADLIPEPTQTAIVPPAVTEPTGQPAPDAKTYTQDQIDQMIKDRLDRERKKYSDYSELKAKAAKADELEKAKLTEDEKRDARIKDLEAQDAAKALQIKDRDIREAKRATIDKLLAEGKVSLPAGTSVSDVLDLVSVNPDETLDTDRLTRLFPPKPPKQSLGSPSQGGQPAPTPSWEEQFNALLAAGKVQQAVQLKNSVFRKSGVIPP